MHSWTSSRKPLGIRGSGAVLMRRSNAVNSNKTMQDHRRYVRITAVRRQKLIARDRPSNSRENGVIGMRHD